MTVTAALSKLRRIDADLLTLYEWHRDPDGGAKVESAWPTLEKLSARLAEALQELDKALQEEKYNVEDAQRWQYLFSSATAFTKKGEVWFLYHRVDSRTIRLLDSGPSLVDLVDKQLGVSQIGTN